MKQGNAINQVLLFILLLLSSCTGEHTDIDVQNQAKGLFKLEMESNQVNDIFTKKIIDNTRLFLFGKNESVFDSEILNLNKGDRSISCKIKEGNWNLAIVSLNNSNLLKTPDKGSSADKQLLYEYKPVIQENKKSSDAEEIFSSFIELPRINKDASQTASASIVRNVAKVEIKINNILGNINTDSPDNYIYLHKVPSKISYTGDLLPDAVTPETLSSPLQAPVQIMTQGNKLHAEKVVFIIPANKGDISGINVISHKMILSVHLKKKDGSFYKSEKEIPLPAKCNEILSVNVDINAGLDISANIHPWIEENHDIDISQGNLIVSKSKVDMSYMDNIYVNSNDPFEISTEGTTEWLNVVKLSDSQIQLIADVESYTGERSTRFSLRTNKIVKEIKVLQRPEKNSISVAPSRVILSPAHPAKSIELNSNENWKLLNPISKATTSPNTGTSGKTTLRFDRSKDNHGDESVTIRNIYSLEDVQIALSNLYMTAPENLEFGGNGGTQTIPVECFGGQKFATVVEHSDFIQWSLTPDKEIKITVPASPVETTRKGRIVIAHADDPDYKIVIPVIQKENIIVTIPEFEYLTYRYFWTSSDGTDLDTGTELINTGLIDRNSGESVDNAPVGWNMKGNNITDVRKSLKWGGDNRNSGNECTFIDMQALLSPENYPLLPRFIEARIYAAWFREKRNGNITFEIVAYKGGKMVQQGYNFVNQGGTEVYKETHHKYVPNKGGSSSAAAYKTKYTFVCKIIYDKIKHSAQVEIIPDAPRTKAYYFNDDLNSKK